MQYEQLQFTLIYEYLVTRATTVAMNNPRLTIPATTLATSINHLKQSDQFYIHKHN